MICFLSHLKHSQFVLYQHLKLSAAPRRNIDIKDYDIIVLVMHEYHP